MPENIITTEYSAEMQQSYINYSMSVITSSAHSHARSQLRFPPPRPRSKSSPECDKKNRPRRHVEASLATCEIIPEM